MNSVLSSFILVLVCNQPATTETTEFDIFYIRGANFVGVDGLYICNREGICTNINQKIVVTREYKLFQSSLVRFWCIKTSEGEAIYLLKDYSIKSPVRYSSNWEKLLGLDQQQIEFYLVDTRCNDSSNPTPALALWSRNYWLNEWNRDNNRKECIIKICLQNKIRQGLRHENNSISFLSQGAIMDWSLTNNHFQTLSYTSDNIFSDILYGNKKEMNFIESDVEYELFSNPLHCFHLDPKHIIFTSELYNGSVEIDQDSDVSISNCIKRSMVYRIVIHRFRQNLDIQFVKTWAKRLISPHQWSSENQQIQTLQLLSIFADILSTGNAAMPLQWICQESDNTLNLISSSDRDCPTGTTRGYSKTMTFLCNSITEGTDPSIAEFIKQLCMTIVLHADIVEVVHQDTTSSQPSNTSPDSVTETDLNDETDEAAVMTRVSFNRDALLSCYHSLLSIGAVELAANQMRVYMARSFKGILGRNVSLELPPPPWEMKQEEELEEIEEISASLPERTGGDDNWSTEDLLYECDWDGLLRELSLSSCEHESVIKELASQSANIRAAVTLSTISSNPKLVVRSHFEFHLLLQAWLQITAPVVLHTSSHTVSRAGLLEARMLRYLALVHLRKFLYACVRDERCDLPPLEEMITGTIRGLFLLAYQGLPHGFSYIHNDWEIPNIYLKLVSLASQTWDWEEHHSFQLPLPNIILGNTLLNGSVTRPLDNGDHSYGDKPINLKKNQISVGFLSAFFSRHSVGRLLGKVITGLDKETFKIHLIQISSGSGSARDDDITISLKREMRNWHKISTSTTLTATMEYVRDLQLHILVFGDIFMDSYTAHLAMMRMASIQVFDYGLTVAFWGHPFTSGYPSIDYFISSVNYEESTLQRTPSRFYEQLVLFETLSSQLYAPPPQLYAPPPTNLAAAAAAASSKEHIFRNKFSRTRTFLLNVLQGKSRPEWSNIFGLPYTVSNPSKDFCLRSQPQEKWHLYGCLQSLMKMHPYFDIVLAQILVRDPCGFIFLSSNPKQPIAQSTLQRRLFEVIKSTFYSQRRHPNHDSLCHTDLEEVYNRVIFVKQMPADRYLELVCDMDVNLDPFPFGGGVTLSDSIYCGVPFVTLPNLQTVHKLGQGFARSNNRTDLIASNISDYISIAINLAEEKINNLRTNSHHTLGMNSPLFTLNDTISEWSSFFIRLSNSFG